MINALLSEGYCPDGWKTSTIISIPKVRKPKKASDFRPINVLPVYEKVLELVVKKQIEDYLESNGILTDNQSGFRRHHSCETALQFVVDEWKMRIDERKMVGVIFLDLKRAFEIIDRNRLLVKLYNYGIRGGVLKWLRSYLSDRSQIVKFNNEVSKLIINKYGVPQGSVLGPLLFIIYINNIMKICPEECTIKMFADDTLIYVVGESSDILERKLNIAFKIVEKWMNKNRLKMNIDKTKFMIIKGVRREQKGRIALKSLDGVELERVEIIIYLGVIIDDKLSFRNHCEYMIKKIGKKTSYLNRIGNYISVYARCTIYKTIIAPHFEYCATLLINMGETQITSLQIMQNRAMRVILQCDRYTRIENMLQALQFMNVRQRLYYNICVFIHKLLNGMLPDHLRSRLVMVGMDSERLTRQTGSIAIHFRKTSNAQKSLFYNGIKMCNRLSNDIKLCKRLCSFRRALKDYIVS